MSMARSSWKGRFLGQFSDGNWYIGAAEYLTACDEYLSLAEAGKPVRESPWAVIAIVVIVSCLIASGVCKVLKMNMKTVRRGAAADEYVTGEGLALTESSDRFMYTTETRTKIKSDSSNGGGIAKHLELQRGRRPRPQRIVLEDELL